MSGRYANQSYISRINEALRGCLRVLPDTKTTQGFFVDGVRYMETISQALKDAAIKYTRKGWRLLPVEPKAKKPVWHDWGNKPITDPTTEAEMIWMTDYNVGVHLGPKGGIIDIECDEDGSL